jgi:hypothetical protein
MALCVCISSWKLEDGGGSSEMDYTCVGNLLSSLNTEEGRVRPAGCEKRGGMAKNLGQGNGILWRSRPGTSSYLLKRHVGIEEINPLAGAIEKESPNYL